MSTTAIQVDTLTLRCHVCDKPVTGKSGYVCVDKKAVYETQRLVEEWEARNPGPVISGSALLDYPSSTPWHIYHRTCDPRPDSDSDYWFWASQVRTAFDLLGWTAHLLGKEWLKDTNWSEFLYGILKANGWRE